MLIRLLSLTCRDDSGSKPVIQVCSHFRFKEQILCFRELVPELLNLGLEITFKHFNVLGELARVTKDFIFKLELLTALRYLVTDCDLLTRETNLPKFENQISNSFCNIFGR